MGIGRQVSRAAGGRRALRPARYLAALRPGRAASDGYDADTGLYFTTALNSDSSGAERLYEDAAHTKPAGLFTWGAPAWHNGQPNSYPAIFTVQFSITAGRYVGSSGTMEVTADDAALDNGLIHLVFQDLEKEQATADFKVNSGSVTANDTIALPDGTDYTEVDVPDTSGGMDCTINFSNGSTETLTMSMDGTGAETYVDAGGQTDATGSLMANGADTLSYNDGTSEQVNVDPSADSGAGSGSGP